ncbi:phosphotransferase [Umezawaea tangerina]|uniref:Aminoglycoside phosphotransferase domain-containing protein n=1 Tax=Umezawaea tangerina TaxID=84725 RepID=A0A2T0SVS4_9PSEU|nr:phosphotransferase [Umezawaea tangerina]PRY37516.1 hypothetical protein CLV43_110328 [Umezawaea tangerina]
MTPPTRLTSWVGKRLGTTADPVLVSTSNSRVWRVRAEDGRRYAVKHLLDGSSQPAAERAVRRILAERGNRRVRPVLDLLRNSDGTHYVLAEYVEGRVLADVLGAAEPVAGWAEQFADLLDEVAAVPVAGFGKLSGDLRAPWPTWSSFLADYLAEQRRKAPGLAISRHTGLEAVLAEAAPLLDALVPTPRLVAADVNNRNFVIGPDGLVNVNLPVLWGGDPTAAYGQSLLHWAGSDGEAVLARRSGAPWWLLHLYAAFHAYVVLAYAERFAPEPLHAVVPWGRTTPLLELFDRHLAAVDLPHASAKDMAS